MTFIIFINIIIKAEFTKTNFAKQRKCKQLKDNFDTPIYKIYHKLIYYPTCYIILLVNIL